MPTNFVAEVSNPAEAFQRLKGWAEVNGYYLTGNPNSGRFRGTPRGIAGMLIGEILGSYSVSGGSVTIQVNKDLPAGAVASALAQHGLRVIRAS